MRRLYLDNAATSFPKPPSVHAAMLEYATRIGASPGRGAYTEAREAGGLVTACRERIGRLINAPSPETVVFTLNATDALNMAIKGVVSAHRRAEPDRRLHIVTSAAEHNSVVRPLHACGNVGVRTTAVSPDAEGGIEPESIRRAIESDTCLVVVQHVGNVTGAIQPLTRIAEVCNEAGVPLLVDAAQSIGHVNIDVQALGIELLAFSGHKGLLGPLGTGGLFVRPGFETRIDPLRHGGTGTDSDLPSHPPEMPERFEAGSTNAVGLAGLSEGVAFVLESLAPNAFIAERTRTAGMLAALVARGVRTESQPARDGPLSALRLLGPGDASRRVGLFSLVHDSVDSHELSALLEAEFGVLTRAGLHCAPGAHRVSGTPTGALRMSLGPFVTESDIQYACESLEKAVAGLAPTEAGWA